MARSLNKVILIGNLTRDPELRYTPQGTAVATIGLATNRQWKTESGDTRDEAEYHRLVVWDKLAEICAQFLKKGRKAYFEGRLQTRKWAGQDGVEKQTTEIVVTDMIVLDSKPAGEETTEFVAEEEKPKAKVEAKKTKKEEKEAEEVEIDDSDIPF
jgi:single-strand DNA-binding protein